MDNQSLALLIPILALSIPVLGLAFAGFRLRRELGEVQERLEFAERLLARPEARDRA